MGAYQGGPIAYLERGLEVNLSGSQVRVMQTCHDVLLDYVKMVIMFTRLEPLGQWRAIPVQRNGALYEDS